MVHPSTPAEGIKESTLVSPSGGGSGLSKKRPHSDLENKTDSESNLESLPKKRKSTQTSDPYQIKIHNLVYTCFINTKINLDFVALKFKELGIGFDYDPKKFAAVFVRSITSLQIPIPKQYEQSETLKEFFYYVNRRSQRTKDIGNVAVLLFSGKKSDEGGKMVCTGVKLQAQARFILEKVEEALQRIGYNASIVKYELQNLVATHRVNGEIDIGSLADSHSTFCTYNSQRFPGAIMRHPDLNKITILIFKSGNLVITGAKEEDKVLSALVKVYPILTSFIKGANIPPPIPNDQTYAGIDKTQIDNFLEEFIVEEYH